MLAIKNDLDRKKKQIVQIKLTLAPLTGKEKQEEKKEDIYENIDEMLGGTLSPDEEK